MIKTIFLTKSKETKKETTQEEQENLKVVQPDPKYKDLKQREEGLKVREKIRSHSKLKEGESYYLLPLNFWKSWKKYVDYENLSDSDEEFETNYPRPVTINSSELLDSEKNLKPKLVDSLDYHLVHESAWELLLKFYGGGPPICRNVIVYGYSKTAIVEVYPYNLTVIHDVEEKPSLQLVLSRKTLIKDLIEMSSKHFKVESSKMFLFDYSIQIKGREFLFKNDTIASAYINDGHSLLLSNKEKKMQQITSSSNTRYNYYGNNYISKPKHKGCTGLNNLGNTCFMNSGLQCLLHAIPLIEYFYNGNYLKEINENNPIGMGGKLANTFGNLVKEYWDGKYSELSPKNFKYILGQFASQFVGYNQQDSQELIAFVLDGLHEDLNRIIKKPYIQAPIKDENETLQEFSDFSWKTHKKRNDSIIVDLFQGQLKNRLHCPFCNKISIKFDPYTFLSLPLPGTLEFKKQITLIFQDPEKNPIKYGIITKKKDGLDGVLAEINNLSGVKKENILLVEVYNQKINKKITNDSRLFNLEENDQLIAYEITTFPEEEFLKIKTLENELIEKNQDVNKENENENENNNRENKENENENENGNGNEIEIKMGNESNVNLIPESADNADNADNADGISDYSDDSSDYYYANDDSLNMANSNSVSNKKEKEKKIVTTIYLELRLKKMGKRETYYKQRTPRYEEHYIGLPRLISLMPKTYSYDELMEYIFPRIKDLIPTVKIDQKKEENNLKQSKITRQKVNEWKNYKNKTRLEHEKRKEQKRQKKIQELKEKEKKKEEREIEKEKEKEKVQENKEKKKNEEINKEKEKKINIEDADAMDGCESGSGYSQSSSYSESEEDNVADHINQNQSAQTYYNIVVSSSEEEDEDPKRSKLNNELEFKDYLYSKWGFYENVLHPFFHIYQTKKYPPVHIKKDSTIKLTQNTTFEIYWNPNLYDNEASENENENEKDNEKENEKENENENENENTKKNFGSKFKLFDSHKTYNDLIEESKEKKKKVINLEHCLDLFNSEEKLGIDDKWYCNNCKEHVQAMKKFDIWTAPEILIFQLKRFSYTSSQRKKISDLINFPEEIDLKKYIKSEKCADKKYRLFGVSNHYGRIGGGHYTAYVKNPTTNKWYHYDDSSVSDMDNFKKVVTSAAYVLFYRRMKEDDQDLKIIPKMFQENVNNKEDEKNIKNDQKNEAEEDENNNDNDNKNENENENEIEKEIENEKENEKNENENENKMEIEIEMEK
ncbi:ubiquitin carboxyl-terminal hydrolase 10-related [Anaeramoeba flamelloides]|uniref:ubiquitinyl hydrolase 1 n=1 Tax=Anaeramoeba flamelloides TaxID=1746091 RepID=A0ABQ8ZFM6_9EUKA|nr:ubiquitin carboxyl-terminal hydrolase 10-related [Anaeramoeba flamelloides]